MENFKAMKRNAREAGLLYLAMAFTGVYGIMYVPGSVVVSDDPAATAANILANEFLFRSGIFSNFACQTIFIFLALSLYRLLHSVDVQAARILVGLVVASVPVAFFIIFNQVFSLILLKQDLAGGLDMAQRSSLAFAFMKMYNNSTTIIGIFWGLWLIPFGQLVYKSGFIPRILGIFLVVGGLSYVIDASVFMLFPDFQKWSGIFVGIASSIAEFSMVIWLLAIGVRQPKASAI